MCNKKRADKIKNCPCCGEKAKLYKKRSYFDFFIVGCTECGIRTEDLPAKNMAIDKWNARKPVDQMVDKLSEFKEQCNDAIDYGEGMKDATKYAIAVVKEVGEIDG